MASDHKKLRQFSDTSDSFCPSRHHDSYPHPKEHQYKNIIQNNARAVSSLLEENNPTKDQIQAVLINFQKSINPILSELLSETAQVRKKLRNEHERYQSMMREQKSKYRRISEQNVSLTSELQALQQNNIEGSSKLKLKLRGQASQNKDLNKEIQGLQSLLAEYQKELQKKDRQTEDLKKQCSKKDSLYEEAKVQIINQAKQLEELKDINAQMMDALRNQEFVLAKVDEQRLQRLAEQDHQFREQLYHKNQKICYLVTSEKQKDMKIEDMYRLLAELKDELEKEKANSRKAELQARKDRQKLKDNTDKAIKSLKQKYEFKLRKMADLLKKELKRTKKQIEILKTLIPKQTALAFQQTKNILLAHLCYD